MDYNSEAPLPKWEPPPITEKETLRREYKKYYGFKPCSMTVPEIQRAIDAAKQKSGYLTPLIKEGWPTVGDTITKK